MKAVLSLAASCFAACSLCAQEANSTLAVRLGDAWKVFLNVEAPASYGAVPETLKSAGKGGEVQARAAKMENDAIDLAALAGAFDVGAVAVLFNEFDSPSAGTGRLGASADWWMEVYVNGLAVMDTMKSGNGESNYKPSDHVFSFPVLKGRNLIAAKVKSGSAGWRFVCGTPQAQLELPNLKFEANGEWKVAKMDDLYIKEGSALDQSALADIPLDAAPGGAKRLPRLGVGPDGKLEAEGRPGIPIRLKGSSYNGVWLAGALKRQSENTLADWKDVVRKEVVDFKRQGYNLMRVSPPNLGSLEKSFAPETVEKTDFIASELSANGIYLIVDCGSYLRNSWDRGDSRLDYCLRTYLGEEEMRAAWKRGTETLLNHLNSFTGLAWKDDPSLACVIANNEQEWAYLHPKSSNDKITQAQLDKKYRQWLERKYKAPSSLAKAWGDPSIKAFADAAAPESFPYGAKQPKDCDYVAFWEELSLENAKWMRETIRATGYKGLISFYNISHWLGGQEAKWESSQVSIANSYHCHPSSFDNKGSKCGQGSSVADAGAYWRGIASMRFADRPFIETEFNHAFWNPYQYECGPLFCGYSALQGFDSLMIHSEPVFHFASNRPGLSVFCVGRSPVSRAGELLSDFIFLRGDVRPSPHRVELQFEKEHLASEGHASGGVSGEQNKIALMTGFSIEFPWAKRPDGVEKASAPDLTMPPTDGGEFKSAGGGWAVEAVESKSQKLSLDAAVAGMKEKGVLPKDNISVPSKGIFQSDTGELTMRTKEKLLKIVTPRSEAVTLTANKGEKLGSLNVVNVSVPGMAAACSLDKKPLAESKRIVLIFSTEAVNSGMELSSDRTTLVNLGKPPVLIRAGILEAVIENANGGKMELYALGFNGERRERLPLLFRDGALEIMIDTSALKDGPTPFFELVAEK